MIEPQPAGRDEVEIAYTALIRHWPRLREWLPADPAVSLWREASPKWERLEQEEGDLTQVRRRIRCLATQRRRRITSRVRRSLPSVISSIDRGPAPASTSTSQSIVDGDVEVAHEALIRHWPRLRDRLEADRAALLLRETIREAAQEWERHDRDESYLAHRGRRLAEAEALTHHPRFTLNAQEQAYLDAAIALREREEQEREVRQRQELEAARQLAEEAEARREAESEARREAEQRVAEQAVAARQLRRRFIVSAGLGALAVLAAIYAFYNFREAGLQRDAAEEQARLARSRQLAAQALDLRDSQADLALLLSVEANRIADTAEARGSALTSLLTTPHLLRVLSGHKGGEHLGVGSLAFSPDGQVLASGGCNSMYEFLLLCDRGEIRLWDVGTGKPRGPVLAGHSGEVMALAFSPDGKTLASIGELGNGESVYSWGTESGQPIGGPVTYPVLMIAAALSPDGKLVASSTVRDEIIVVWDAATGEPAAPPLVGHTDWITSLAFSPDGKTLASGSGDGTAILWDIATGNQRHPPLRASGGAVRSVAFSLDGTVLASGGDDGSVMLWDVATGQPRGQPLIGHTTSVESLAFSSDRKTLASGSADGAIILWDLATGRPYGEPLTGNASRVESLLFSPDGKTLASGHGNGAIALWDVVGRPLGTVLMSHPNPEGINGGTSQFPLAFSPDGATLAWTERSTTRGGTVVLWDVAAGRLQVQPLAGGADIVTDLVFSPDGQTLAWGTDDGAITLWDVTSEAARGPPLDGHNEAWVDELAFSPDGKTLASSDLHEETGFAILWDVAPERPLRPRLTLRSDERSTSLAFVGDGKTLVSGHAYGTITLWDTSTGEPLGEPLRCQNEDGRIYSLAVSPDSKMLAASCAFATITLWDLDSRQALVDLRTGDQSDVNSLAFSPDGRTLASGSASVMLWDVATGQPLGPPLDQDLSWSRLSVAFSPDGKSLAAGFENFEETGVAVWDVDVESWITRACRKAERNLTPDEWRLYFPGEAYHETCPGVAPSGSAASPIPAATVSPTTMPAATPALFPAAMQTVADAAAAASIGDADRAVTAYKEALQLAAESGDAEINNAVCWSGSLDGYADLVLPACERAVELAPERDRGFYRDSRGLARALTGDLSGAADDFEAFVEWSQFNDMYSDFGEKREAWIADLEANRSPFDAATLNELRSEGTEVAPLEDGIDSMGSTATPPSYQGVAMPVPSGSPSAPSAPVLLPLPSPPVTATIASPLASA